MQVWNCLAVLSFRVDARERERERVPAYKFHVVTWGVCAFFQTTVSWDGDSLVCVQKGEKEGRGWTHWLEGDKLHLVRIYNCGEKRRGGYCTRKMALEGGKRGQIRRSLRENMQIRQTFEVFVSKKLSLIKDALWSQRL